VTETFSGITKQLAISVGVYCADAVTAASPGSVQTYYVSEAAL